MSKKAAAHIDLDKFWPYHVIVLADQISRHTHSVAKAEAGLNLSQWRVLAAVADKPGRTAAEVTNVTPMDKSIVSRAVSSLIEAELIKKYPTKKDKRQFSLQTTPAGLRIYKKIALQLNETMAASLLDLKDGLIFIETIKAFSAKIL